MMHPSGGGSVAFPSASAAGGRPLNERPAASAGQRLMSLDAIRGITIAGMILVNNPGSWSTIHGPLRHAQWNGWTPTDLVFPFFLFIVGGAMAFALDRRIEQGASRIGLFGQAVRRAAVIFLLGMVLAGFPQWRLIGPYLLMIAGITMFCWYSPVWSLGASTRERVVTAVGALLCVGAIAYFALDFATFQASHVRVPGVLQRIAVCYLAATLVLLAGRVPLRVAALVVLLVVYQWIVATVTPPAGYTAEVVGAPGLLHDWIDVRVLGDHLYSERPDPEGLLSTLPAIATVLCGLLAGGWLRGPRDEREKAVGLFFAANVLLVAGLMLDGWIPINKKIWTSSYVLVTGGLAMHVLAMCYWLIDVRRRRSWAIPFVVFGTNAIVVYVASSLTARILIRWKIVGAGGAEIPLKTWLYQEFFTSWASPANASLLYALSYVLLWLLLLIPLYRARVFIRV